MSRITGALRWFAEMTGGHENVRLSFLGAKIAANGTLRRTIVSLADYYRDAVFSIHNVVFAVRHASRPVRLRRSPVFKALPGSSAIHSRLGCHVPMASREVAHAALGSLVCGWGKR